MRGVLIGLSELRTEIDRGQKPITQCLFCLKTQDHHTRVALFVARVVLLIFSVNRHLRSGIWEREAFENAVALEGISLTQIFQGDVTTTPQQKQNYTSNHLQIAWWRNHGRPHSCTPYSPIYCSVSTSVLYHPRQQKAALGSPTTSTDAGTMEQHHSCW